MSGFSESNIGKMSGLIGKTPTIEVFTSNGTWTKPNNITTVAIQLIGAGGGGGAGGKSVTAGGGGGGGGAIQNWIGRASDLPATLSITIAAGGEGGAGARGGDGPSLGGQGGGGGGSGYSNGEITLLTSTTLSTGTRIGGNDDTAFVSIEATSVASDNEPVIPAASTL